MITIERQIIIHEDVKEIIFAWIRGKKRISDKIIEDCREELAKKDYTNEEFIEAGFTLNYMLSKTIELVEEYPKI